MKKKPQLTEEEFVLLLEELQRTNLLRVCGSFAKGRAREGSDIDFVVKEDPLDETKPKAMSRIIEILDRHRVKWDSILPGQISTPRNLFHLPRPLEFMSRGWIKPTPKTDRLAEVDLWGVKFKTY